MSSLPIHPGSFPEGAILRATLDALSCGALERLLGGLSRLTTSLTMSKRPRDGAGATPELLFVGLRNPGAAYEGTRHNAGAMALDALVEESASFASWRPSDGADVSLGALGGVPVLAAKPNSFMNLSGRSVQALAARHGLAAANVLVLHDDLDLAPGRLKLKSGGSSGGHRGIESITSKLATPTFWRLRVGIGRPPSREEVSEFVLSRLGSAEREALVATFRRLVQTSHMLPAALATDAGHSSFLNAVADDARAAAAAAKRAAADAAAERSGAPRRAADAADAADAAGGAAEVGETLPATAVSAARKRAKSGDASHGAAEVPKP